MILWAAGACLAAGIGVAAHGAEERVVRNFERRQLDSKFYCEGATAADFNRDGAIDLVAGPFIFLGPDFKERREIYSAKAFDIEGYSDNFFVFPFDVDGDKWTDVVSVGFPGAEACWFHNPQGQAGTWERHVLAPIVDNESPTFADLTGDGRPELIFHVEGRFGYAEIPREAPERLWRFTPISSPRGYERFNHGLGVGDVNGDQRADVLERNGWWEQPATESAGAEWKFHEVKFADAGGAQMFAYDLDGDGDNDVITSKAAHAYGLSWFENTSGKGAASPKFVEHVIMGDRPEQNEYGLAISELHALALVDMDGDGVKDIVTGKRFWAHSSHDPGALEPPLLVWFRTVRDGGEVHFTPYEIDDDSGVGTQVVVEDVNKDSLPDVIVGNKKGIFLFTQKTRDVDATTWEKLQPTKTSLIEAPEATSAAKSEVAAGAADKGKPATNSQGNRLNLDLERGSLADWTASGNAMAGQPIEGDVVNRRRGDMISGHAGRFWIGTFERGQDGPQGKLTSLNFKATHPWASFLIGGGKLPGTRVEIVRADDGEVVATARGQNNDQMQRVAVDLSQVVGKEILVRIVDEESGSWGHVNFDDFLFHDKKPEVTVLATPAAPKADEYPFAKLPADEAARAMKLPEGFSVQVFAAEPDVKQPIAMALDDRGRVWIAEAYEYPQRALLKGRDRILIFEDKDGDGKFDERKVFTEGLNLVSGLEIGFGGVWVGAAPYLMFIPDVDRDDKPDGEPEIVLDGWGYQDTHETLNSFIWGPDGWLYGCHGVFTHSRVGKPGTPDAERTPINAGIWRYHPTRHVFEVFAEGTSNPWGIDFDDNGQAFETACVIPHLYHMIQGGRFQRQAGAHFNPYTYDDIKTIADHVHFVGNWNSPHTGNNRSDSTGGGHAHAGAMIYLGGAWPEKYRGELFMNNIHGQRLNVDSLHRQGSGFVGRHENDFLLTQDWASQMLNFRYGPDGQVYVIDWYDMQACHDGNADAHDRSNGRIYKIVYEGGKKVGLVDLQTKSDEELAELAAAENDWYVRHARRILQERAARGVKLDQSRSKLWSAVVGDKSVPRKLRALWVLHATGGVNATQSRALLESESDYVRAWAIQLGLDVDDGILKVSPAQLAAMAKADKSPVVRLYIASAAGRLPAGERWEIVESLVRHSEDADDHNLPLMYWYAAEPLAEVDLGRALSLGLSCRESMPIVAEFMLRRIGSLGTAESLASLVRALGTSEDAAEQEFVLKAVRTALGGRRQVSPPSEWAGAFAKLKASPSEAVRRAAIALGVVFGDSEAMESLRRVARTQQADAKERREAIDSLVAANDPAIGPILISLVKDPQLCEQALKGLAAVEDPETPKAVLETYNGFTLSQKRLALATLASRPVFAIELLKAVAAKKLPASDLSADLIGQLRNLHDGEVEKLVSDAWGQVRTTPADKLALVAKYKQLVESTSPNNVDKELGRAVFARTCQQCHTLYGAGAKIGPDLTGSNRSDLNYLLSNVVDPNALIPKEYQTTVIMNADGRVITGIAVAEDEAAVTVKNATETVVIPQDEIENRMLSDASLMPENQLAQFTDREITSLLGYLREKAQCPLLATKETEGLLFNGQDLAGWQGDLELWSVQDGEIVGKTTGLEKNSFLVSDLAAEDFKLSLEVKLVDNAGNSGIQFRSQPLDGYHEIRGLQADIGVGWWGKLYEENGRELLWEKSGEEFVNPGEWNSYEIIAEGPHIRTWINGKPCVDLKDAEGAKRGVFALQLHSGGPTEVRFRNLKLEVLAEAKE
jgi:putative membrane-bound dehydrogenase-like protein